MSNWDRGQKVGQQNPHQQVATPQQIPNHQERQDFNNGLRNGQGKGK